MDAAQRKAVAAHTAWKRAGEDYEVTRRVREQIVETMASPISMTDRARLRAAQRTKDRAAENCREANDRLSLANAAVSAAATALERALRLQTLNG